MNNEDVFVCELCEDTKVIGEESDVIQKFARVYQVVGDGDYTILTNRHEILVAGLKDIIYSSSSNYDSFNDFLKALEEAIND